MNTSAVLAGLTQFAVLVQGCWVVKSEILYPEGTKSPVSGIDAAKLWPKRDYVMFCFNRKRLLSRKEVATNTRLPTEELREVLEQMGKQRPAQGWEFVQNTDEEFLKTYTEECSNQLVMWKQKYKDLMELLHLNEEIPDSEWNEKTFPGLFPGHTRKSVNSRRRVPSQTLSGSDSDKSKSSKGRNRTKSQSSQDGSDIDIKPDKLAINNGKLPSKSSDRLATTYTDDKGSTKLGFSYKSKRMSTKPTLSPTKSPNKVSKEISKGGLKKDSVKARLKPSLGDSTPVDITDDSMEVDASNSAPADDDALDVKPDVDVLNKQVQFMEGKNASKEIESLDENVEMIEADDDEEEEEEEDEADSEDEQPPQKSKRKRMGPAVISDDDDDDDDDATSGDVYMDSTKSVNEVEVDAVDVVDNDSRDNDNTEIFVPPTLGRDMNEEQVRPPSDIFVKELKKFCSEAIQSGCLSLKDLQEVLKMRQQEPGNILCSGVSDEELVDALKDSGAFEIPIKWTEPDSIPTEWKRIFIYRELGEPSDKYRVIVIDLFAKSQSLKRKDIYEAFRRTLNEEPSSHMYTKFLSEFCQNHQGQWYLNGTFRTIKKYT